MDSKSIRPSGSQPLRWIERQRIIIALVFIGAPAFVVMSFQDNLVVPGAPGGMLTGTDSTEVGAVPGKQATVDGSPVRSASDDEVAGRMAILSGMDEQEWDLLMAGVAEPTPGPLGVLDPAALSDMPAAFQALSDWKWKQVRNEERVSISGEASHATKWLAMALPRIGQLVVAGGIEASSAPVDPREPSYRCRMRRVRDVLLLEVLASSWRITMRIRDGNDVPERDLFAKVLHGAPR